MFLSNLKVLSDLDGGQRALEALHNFWWQGQFKKTAVFYSLCKKNFSSIVPVRKAVSRGEPGTKHFFHFILKSGNSLKQLFKSCKISVFCDLASDKLYNCIGMNVSRQNDNVVFVDQCGVNRKLIVCHVTFPALASSYVSFIDF